MPTEVTLRDIMEVKDEILKAVSDLRKEMGTEVSANRNHINDLNDKVARIETKIGLSATLQFSISVILSTIATWLGVKGGV
jgi:hypothetical protein